MIPALLLAAATLVSPQYTGNTSAGRREAMWFEHDGISTNPGVKDRFSVVKPVAASEGNAPLLVVLHWRGAGMPGKGVDMQTQVSDDKDAVFSAPDDFFILNLDDIRDYNIIFGRTHDDYWWGATAEYKGPVEEDVQRLYLKPTPCEERILATVEWVAANFPIDRKRIYLCGNSMGGQAATAIGLAHGDVFAAVNANVPATPWYAVGRLGLDDDSNAARFPDPPIYVDWSGVNDPWSRDRHRVIDSRPSRKWPHIVLWGDFGHCGHVSKAREKNDLVERFDWLSARLDEAYPAFTSASCDDVLPWPFSVWKPKTRWFGPCAGDIYEAEMEPGHRAPKAGGMNAFFRWRNIKDGESGFAMELYIASPEELCTTQFAVPEAAVADVAIRRIQSASISAATQVEWSYGEKTGTVPKQPGGPVIIENLPLTRNKETLYLKSVTCKEE